MRFQPFAFTVAIVLTAFTSLVSSWQSPGVRSEDLYKLQSVGDVQASSDGDHVAYAVQSSDRPGRPYSRLWMMSLSARKSWRVGGDSAS